MRQVISSIPGHNLVEYPKKMFSSSTVKKYSIFTSQSDKDFICKHQEVHTYHITVMTIVWKYQTLKAR